MNFKDEYLNTGINDPNELVCVFVRPNIGKSGYEWSRIARYGSLGDLTGVIHVQEVSKCVGYDKGLCILGITKCPLVTRRLSTAGSEESR